MGSGLRGLGFRVQSLGFGVAQGDGVESGGGVEGSPQRGALRV